VLRNHYKSFADILRITKNWPDQDKLTEIYRNHLLGLKYEPYKEVLNELKWLENNASLDVIKVEQQIDELKQNNTWLISPEDAPEDWKPEPEINPVTDQEIVDFKQEHWYELRRAAYNNDEFIRLLKEANCDFFFRNDTTRKIEAQNWESQIKEFIPKP
jgi:hypothetical protein